MEKPSNDTTIWKSGPFLFFCNHHKISNNKTKWKPPFQHDAIDQEVIESANIIIVPRPIKNDISDYMMDMFSGKSEIFSFKFNRTNYTLPVESLNALNLIKSFDLRPSFLFKYTFSILGVLRSLSRTLKIECNFDLLINEGYPRPFTSIRRFYKTLPLTRDNKVFKYKETQPNLDVQRILRCQNH